MSKALDEYYEALDRLKANKAEIVPKGAKISKDSVALEAGRKRGSIKNSRAVFTDLIKDIANAAQNQNLKTKPKKEKEDKLRGDRDKYKRLYEESLGRELSMLRQINDLKAVINGIEDKKIVKVTKI
ncbi:hypothetical protein [Aliikangiella sp. IMCC44359]|uniref:hypothetical protein n=1 Tax=Aliikangiella sp. IMCC44359 TaxID=3459125 RepID=UPI00403B15D5